MAVTKQYLKSKPICRVRFAVPKSLSQGASEVSVVGDFNNWDPKQHPMYALKKGGFSACIDLVPGQRYEFRYVLDGHIWINEAEADELVATPFGSENSVLDL